MSATTAQQFVLDAVEGAGFPAPFKKLILLALSQPGRILDNDHPSRFHDVISATCSASHGRVDLVPRAAAAFEFSIAASDILDEIEDGDDSVVCSQFGMPRALNASTALLGLSFSALSTLQFDSVHRSMFLELTRILSTTITRSTIGQDADLASVQGGSSSIQTAFEIARAKSGSLIAGASVFGATLGTDNREMLALYYEFGSHLGTAYQLSNDFRDARSNLKSDVSTGKNTVPIAFQSQDANAPAQSNDESSLRASGALQFTWVLMETERNSCRRVITELGKHDQNVTPLELLVGDQ